MTRTTTAAALCALAAFLGAAFPAVAAGPTTLRMDGIGPLKLGMSRSAAVKTGWLADKGKGCPLGSPVPTTYRFTGPKAPAGLEGSAEFNGGKLTDISFSAGVRTAWDVKVGSTTVARMVARYRKAGFTVHAKYDKTFQGTFVTVLAKHGVGAAIEGFASGSVIETLAIPGVQVCD